MRATELQRIRHVGAMHTSRAPMAAARRGDARAPMLGSTMIDRRHLGRDDVQRIPAQGCTHPETRRVDEPIGREMLRALGVVTCERCHEALRIHGRRMARELPRRH